MKVLGFILIIFGFGFLIPMAHAIRMYSIDGNSLWFLTIIGAPIMGAVIVGFGFAVREDA